MCLLNEKMTIIEFAKRRKWKRETQGKQFNAEYL